MQVDESFLDWFASQTRNNNVIQLDPYADGWLHAAEQHEWVATLQQVRHSLRQRDRDQHSANTKIPANPGARETVMATLINHQTERYPFHKTISELITSLELALEQTAPVRLEGN